MSKTLSRSDPALRAVFDLAEHLNTGRKLPEDSRALLLEALNSGINSSFEISFYAALGLKCWGGITPMQRVGLSRRDRSLCRMRRRVPEWTELSVSAAAKAMAASAKRYEATRWPRERDSVCGPAAMPNSMWWSLLRAGVPIPGERRMAQILQLEIQDGFEFRKDSPIVASEGDDDGRNTHT